MIRVGLVGCGGIMGAHLPGWRSVAGRAAVTATCDVNERSAARRAREMGGGAQVYTDWKEMLAGDVVDAVDLALPHRLHRDAIVDAADAGKHVITEKPLCTTLDEARDIEAAIARNGVTLMCAHNQMFEPAPRTARRWVKEGKIGRLFSIRTVDCFRMGPTMDKDRWDWRGSASEAGGGCALDTGYHPAYLLISIAGADPKQVVSFYDNFDSPSLDAEDSAQTMVRFANGAIGTLQTSWGHHWPAGQWQFHAIGERGQIYGRGNDLFFHPNEGEPVREKLTPVDGFVGEIAHFVECIETGATPEQGLHEGVTVLKLILGGYESQSTRHIVEL